MVVPPKHTSKWSFVVGKPMVVGEPHHFRKPPYNLGPRVPWKIKVIFLQDVRRLKSAGRSWCWLLQLVYTFGLVVDRAWLANLKQCAFSAQTWCCQQMEMHFDVPKMRSLEKFSNSNTVCTLDLLHTSTWWCIWVFPKIGVPQNGWFIMEIPIKLDDLGWKPTIFGNTHIVDIHIIHHMCVFDVRGSQQRSQQRRTFSSKKSSNWNWNVENFSSWWLNQPIWKILVKMGSSSPTRGENKKYLKPPPSFTSIKKKSWVLRNLYQYPNFNPIFTQTTPGSLKKKGTNPNFNGLLQREIPQNYPIKMCIKFDPPQHGPSWWLNQPIWANMRQSNWVHLSPIFGDEKQKIWMKPSTRVPWLMTPNLFTQNPTPTLPPSPNFPPV